MVVNRYIAPPHDRVFEMKSAEGFLGSIVDRNILASEDYFCMKKYFKDVCCN